MPSHSSPVIVVTLLAEILYRGGARPHWDRRTVNHEVMDNRVCAQENLRAVRFSRTGFELKVYSLRE